MEDHGLDEDLLSTLEFIIGPHAIMFPRKRIFIDTSFVQLCIKCVNRQKMWKDFDYKLQKEIIIDEVKEEDFDDVGETLN